MAVAASSPSPHPNAATTCARRWRPGGALLDFRVETDGLIVR
ncbi:MAG: hypothetical protein R2712_04210 [Vicinamibacterales bacterium]